MTNEVESRPASALPAAAGILVPRQPQPAEASPPVQALTPGELRVLRGVEKAVSEHGNPSIREISRCTGDLGLGHIHSYLRRLAEKGYVTISRNPHRTRSVRLLVTAVDAEQFVPSKRKAPFQVRARYRRVTCARCDREHPACLMTKHGGKLICRQCAGVIWLRTA